MSTLQVRFATNSHSIAALLDLHAHLLDLNHQIHMQLQMLLFSSRTDCHVSAGGNVLASWRYISGDWHHAVPSLRPFIFFQVHRLLPLFLWQHRDSWRFHSPRFSSSLRLFCSPCLLYICATWQL